MAEQHGTAPDSIVREGGINQGQGSGTNGDLNDADPTDAALRARRASVGDLVDDNAASHQGGVGAQSGQADYGSAGNLAGTGIAQEGEKISR